MMANNTLAPAFLLSSWNFFLIHIFAKSAPWLHRSRVLSTRVFTSIMLQGTKPRSTHPDATLRALDTLPAPPTEIRKTNVQVLNNDQAGHRRQNLKSRLLGRRNVKIFSTNPSTAAASSPTICSPSPTICGAPPSDLSALSTTSNTIQPNLLNGSPPAPALGTPAHTLPTTFPSKSCSDVLLPLKCIGPECYIALDTPVEEKLQLKSNPLLQKKLRSFLKSLKLKDPAVVIDCVAASTTSERSQLKATILFLCLDSDQQKIIRHLSSN
jgi:hypothetical protein